jgi:hypothetical protein
VCNGKCAVWNGAAIENAKWVLGFVQIKSSFFPTHFPSINFLCCSFLSVLVPRRRPCIISRIMVAYGPLPLIFLFFFRRRRPRSLRGLWFPVLFVDLFRDDRLNWSNRARVLGGVLGVG